MKEATFELTNYCPHFCDFCSSNIVHDLEIAEFINPENMKELTKEHLDIIHLSGGEPLAHPDFYLIYQFCEINCDLIIVHTNLFKAITFNSHVMTHLQVEANITLGDNTEKIHVLKRCEQGYETLRPKIHHSSNYDNACINCEHRLMLPNGQIKDGPCRKEE